MIFKFQKHHRLFFCTSSRHPSPPSSSPQSPSYQCADDLITTLCDRHSFAEALRSFHLLSAERPYIRLRHSTYSRLLLACSRLNSLHHGRLLHHHISFAARPGVILHNHILNMYGKCGSLADARHLFDEMPEKNIVSWTSMISAYSQNDRHKEAVRLYMGMLCTGLVLDQFAIGSTVRACSGLADIELGRQVHCHVIKFGHGSERVVQNALVTMYSKSDMVDDAYIVFERILEKDLVSWGSMMSGFCQQGCEWEALLLFKEMMGLGTHRPNEFHFGSAFSACGSMLHLGFGGQMHGLCVKVGMENNEFAGCAVSDMYARCGRLDCANKVFYQIDMPDVASWNSIIGAFASSGIACEAMKLFSEMRGLGLKPDDITIRCLLCSCTCADSLRHGQLVHSYIIKTGLGMDIPVYNALVAMYAKCSDLPTALDVFELMKSNGDIVSWNTILTACLQHQQPDEVFRLLKVMRCSTYELDQISLNIVLSACADLAYLDLGYQVHAYASKAGLESDMMIRNGLIDMYAKCGSLYDARKMFQLMGCDSDVFSWSSLIVGYAQFGSGKESLELFNHMQKSGIKPNHVTFLGVLTACSHVGLVDEGCYYYSIMQSQYEIIPRREHCSCVIDLLARAGRLGEAEIFINNMPFEPDIVIWKTVLAACRLHKNAEIGRRAAESILKMDPSNSTAHVLLCNIYASCGCWDDVARLRKLMKNSGVKKSPGRSCIEVKGDVNTFIVEDRSHPEAEDIYSMLELLGLEMVETSLARKLLSWNGSLVHF